MTKIQCDNTGIAVHGQEAESLIGRIGMRLEKTFYFGDDAKTAAEKAFVRSVTAYADSNFKQEFKGENGLVASSTGIGNDMGGTNYDVGAGMVARVSENVSLYGRGSVEFGRTTNVAGKATGGLNFNW